MRVLFVCASLACLLLPACSSAEHAREPAASATLSNDLLRKPLSDLNGKPLVLADELQGGKKVALVFWQEW